MGSAFRMFGRRACALPNAAAVIRADAGAAAAEFAMVLPLLVLFVFGIVQYGVMFFAYNNMNNAAREAARALAVGEAADEDAAEAIASNYLLGWSRPHATIEAVIDEAHASGVDFATVQISVPGSEAGIIRYAPVPATLTARVLIRMEE